MIYQAVTHARLRYNIADFGGGESAFRKNPERDPYEVCEQTAILVSLNNLLSYPWLAEKVAQDEVQLDGWYFDMQSGSLVGYDSDQHQFVQLVAPLACPLK